MITDTCRCGAAVTIQHQYYSDEQVTHHRWLEAHAGCRSYSAAKLDAMRSDRIENQQPATQTRGATVPTFDRCRGCQSHRSGTAALTGQTQEYCNEDGLCLRPDGEACDEYRAHTHQDAPESV